MEINQREFLNWYFSGSDQEQESTLIAIGQRVQDELLNYGDSNISVEDLIEESNIELFKEYTNGK